MKLTVTKKAGKIIFEFMADAATAPQKHEFDEAGIQNIIKILEMAVTSKVLNFTLEI